MVRNFLGKLEASNSIKITVIRNKKLFASIVPRLLSKTATNFSAAPGLKIFVNAPIELSIP